MDALGPRSEQWFLGPCQGHHSPEWASHEAACWALCGGCSRWTRGPRLAVCPWKLRSSRPSNDYGVKGTADFIYQICC